MQVLTIALTVSDVKELQKALIAKLKEYEAHITEGEIVEATYKAEKEEESKSRILNQIIVGSRNEEPYKTLTEISFISENSKDETCTTSFLTGINETEGSTFIDSLKEKIFKPYQTWKQLHAPDTKEYSTRVVIFWMNYD